MKYHKHKIEVIKDSDIIGGKYYQIYLGREYITATWTLSNAKEFIDSYHDGNYSWNVLC